MRIGIVRETDYKGIGEDIIYETLEDRYTYLNGMVIETHGNNGNLRVLSPNIKGKERYQVGELVGVRNIHSNGSCKIDKIDGLSLNPEFLSSLNNLLTAENEQLAIEHSNLQYYSSNATPKAIKQRIYSIEQRKIVIKTLVGYLSELILLFDTKTKLSENDEFSKQVNEFVNYSYQNKISLSEWNKFFRTYQRNKFTSDKQTLETLAGALFSAAVIEIKTLDELYLFEQNKDRLLVDLLSQSNIADNPSFGFN